MRRSADSGTLEALERSYQGVRQDGYGQFQASLYRTLLGPEALAQLPEVLASYAQLPPDPHMGDGGSYRYRAYSRFRIRLGGDGLPEWAPLSGHSIFQSVQDNPVNGGVLRTFAPLADQVALGPFLKGMVTLDFTHALACDPALAAQDLAVGVHQVRIVARPRAEGHPAPEGVHRDRERFTFQHFMARSHIQGGEFRAYDSAKQLRFAWLQEACLDTVMFTGETWHSATPISVLESETEGHRDIFLIDFDAL
jgi:hypothetical protein